MLPVVERWTQEASEQISARIAPYITKRLGTGKRAREFSARLAEFGPDLLFTYFDLYRSHWDVPYLYESLIRVCVDAATVRKKRHVRRDRAPADWTHSNQTVFAMVYVDLFCGTLDRLPTTIDHLRSLGVTQLHLMPPYAVAEPNSDGGYAVADYHNTRADLGSMTDLRDAINTLDDAGIGVTLDFVANHTADSHSWAEAAKKGDQEYTDFYYLYPDRKEPDMYTASLRSIFPDRDGDSFVWRPDVMGGSWVWATFHEYQWDLNYGNPAVTKAMVGELLHVANLGASVIRADATPFLWKELGTSCENLDQAHMLIRVFSSALKLVAPSAALLSEAIVHPDEVSRFVNPDEARLGYNPLVMASIWEALATRQTRLLEVGVANRMTLSPGCQWLTYLRCHDDIGWGFADEDARSLGIDPTGHRAFLNEFYSGEFPGSFAAGRRFQANPATGDARISGTLASLAGLEQALEQAAPHLIDDAVKRILMAHGFILTVGGIPLLYLGDELGQLNDCSYLNDDHKASDNRWIHRPDYPWKTLQFSEDGSGAPGRILGGLRNLIGLRGTIPALDGPESTTQAVKTNHPSVIAITRTANDQDFVGVFNFSEATVPVGLTMEGFAAATGPAAGFSELGPYEFGWYVKGREG